MISITKEFKFESAHYLENRNYTDNENLVVYKSCSGLCHGTSKKKYHGHSYKMQVTISGEITDSGFIMNFVDLKEIVNQEVINKFDHNCLNDIMQNTICTVENMLLWIITETNLKNRLEEYDVKLESIKIWETDTSFATWKNI